MNIQESKRCTIKRRVHEIVDLKFCLQDRLNTLFIACYYAHSLSDSDYQQQVNRIYRLINLSTDRLLALQEKIDSA